ncbi:MAG TPA: tetratricopeptide repeat protein [Candidatus Eisenbacteria bacterium]|nr:tetratricopeptide repeat protein [Candidatus Eisenbacteria bacterium]
MTQAKTSGKKGIRLMVALRHICFLTLALLAAHTAMAQESSPPEPSRPDSGQVEILLFEGHLALEEDRIPEAVKAFADVVRMAPDLGEGHLWYAEALVRALRAGLIEDTKDAALLALQQYQWVLERNPGSEQAKTGAEFLMATFLQDEMAPFKTEGGRAKWRAGREAQAKGDWKRAQVEFKEAVRLEPGVSFGHRSLGQSQLELGKPKDAVKSLKRAVELSPEDAQASLLLGRAQEASGDRKAALATYEALLTGSGRGSEAAQRVVALIGAKPAGKRSGADLGLLGRAYLELGDSLAAPTLEAAVAKEPSLKNRRNLGIAEFLRGRDDVAVTHLEAVSKADTTDLESLYYLAAAHLRRNETETGRDILRRAMARDPEDMNVQKLLGLSLAEDPDEAEEALALLNRAHAGGARIENYGCILGSLYMRVGDPHRALLAFQNCVADNPDEANAYYGLGVLYDDRGDSRRAMDYLEKYLTLDPTPDRAALFRLGVAYLRSGQDSRGFTTLRRIVKPDSTTGAPPDTSQISDLEILEATSYFLASSRRFEDAIFIGEILLTRAPENAIYNNNLAMSYADANREPGRAHSLAVKANHLSPNNAGYLDTLGWALARLKRYKESETTLLRSLDLAKGEGLKNLSEIYYHLGFVFGETNRPDKAKEYLTLALENPPTPYLRDEIQRRLDQGASPAEPR